MLPITSRRERRGSRGTQDLDLTQSVRFFGVKRSSQMASRLLFGHLLFHNRLTSTCLTVVGGLLLFFLLACGPKKVAVTNSDQSIQGVHRPGRLEPTKGPRFEPHLFGSIEFRIWTWIEQEKAKWRSPSGMPWLALAMRQLPPCST